MNTVEFAGLCGMYGWQRINCRCQTHVIVKHARGVTITMPMDTFAAMQSEQAVRLLKLGAGLDRQAGNEQEGA